MKILLFLSFSFFVVYSQPIIISSFAEIKDKNFNTGLLLQADNYEIKALSDLTLIFYTEKKDSLPYGYENIAVYKSKDNKYRYSYFNIDIEKDIINFKKGEKIGRLLSGKECFIEIENLENNSFINPIMFLDFKDTKKPVIADIYIQENSEKKSLLTYSTFTIKKNSKLFIKCYDFIDGIYTPVVPYQIKFYINGEEIKKLTFDSLDKNEILHNKLKASDVYLNNEKFNFYLGELNTLPGVIGIKIIVEDFNKNREEFKRAIKIDL